MKPGRNLTIIVIVAMLCITGLELFALARGVNGVLLTATIGALAGIPAWFISKKVAERQKNGN